MRSVAISVSETGWGNGRVGRSAQRPTRPSAAGGLWGNKGSRFRRPTVGPASSGPWAIYETLYLTGRLR